jgi:anthranilate phosphoribosyltransferase
MRDVMREIMTGQCTDAQIGAFMMAMRMKSESIDEIVGAVSVMRELADKVELKTLDGVVDVVGTGGDGANIFNVSTAPPSWSRRPAAPWPSTVTVRCRQERQRRLAGSRRYLPEPDAGAGGPLHRQRRHRFHVCPDPSQGDEARRRPASRPGPAYPVQHARPAYESGRCEASGGRRVHQALCRPLAEVLQRLGSKHVLVVHSKDGLDEFSLAAPTFVAELKNDEITEYWVEPEDLGMKSQSLHGLAVEARRRRWS